MKVTRSCAPSSVSGSRRPVDGPSLAGGVSREAVIARAAAARTAAAVNAERDADYAAARATECDSAYAAAREALPPPRCAAQDAVATAAGAARTEVAEARASFRVFLFGAFVFFFTFGEIFGPRGGSEAAS